MSRLPARVTFGRYVGLLVPNVLAIVMGLCVVNCAGGASPPQDPNAPIGVETSQAAVVIENRVGMPLDDVEVTIIPVGGATEFKKYAGRIDNAAKRELVLGEFLGRDGTPFSLRVVRPKTVRVTAKDLTNKPYKVEVGWR